MRSFVTLTHSFRTPNLPLAALLRWSSRFILFSLFEREVWMQVRLERDTSRPIGSERTRKWPVYDDRDVEEQKTLRELLSKRIPSSRTRQRNRSFPLFFHPFILPIPSFDARVHSFLDEQCVHDTTKNDACDTWTSLPLPSLPTFRPSEGGSGRNERKGRSFPTTGIPSIFEGARRISFGSRRASKRSSTSWRADASRVTSQGRGPSHSPTPLREDSPSDRNRWTPSSSGHVPFWRIGALETDRERTRGIHPIETGILFLLQGEAKEKWC